MDNNCYFSYNTLRSNNDTDKIYFQKYEADDALLILKNKNAPEEEKERAMNVLLFGKLLRVHGRKLLISRN